MIFDTPTELGAAVLIQDLDITGFHVRPAPEPEPTPVPTPRPSVTPEPLPAWAADADDLASVRPRAVDGGCQLDR